MDLEKYAQSEAKMHYELRRPPGLYPTRLDGAACKEYIIPIQR